MTSDELVACMLIVRSVLTGKGAVVMLDELVKDLLKAQSPFVYADETRCSVMIRTVPSKRGS